MDMAAEMDRYFEKWDEYFEAMHKDCIIVESNKERPTKAGTYLTIDSKGSYQRTYFDGGHWAIMPGQNPVTEWFKEKVTTNQPSGANTESCPK